ncbi:H-2 class II histocompatibility antigen, A-U alpha chain-like [Denticeps clupeoides]|uniref:Ig-like domain-containing protein n=1 Tax=Denticeps clupeoides TaxID=299321 RepID=A0AAY4CZ61_9TELE|nr:H-2 class II histocompatibility antigen, A-U alpha chain-like [Denticeps clupeoides]
MIILIVLLSLAGVRYTDAKFVHSDLYLLGCNSDGGEDLYGMEGEVRWYADFKNKKGVISLPDFIPQIDFPGGYEQAVGELQRCKQNLAVSVTAYKNPAEVQDPPQSSIYTMDNVVLGEKNTLVCHIDGFHPPPISVFWTKNDVNVTQGVSLSQYYVNSDYTYNQFSTLDFVPQEGDVYTCTVSHQALEEPSTKEWNVDVPEPSIGPSVFCGVGLFLGLLGVAVGTFFLIKGNNCN